MFDDADDHYYDELYGDTPEFLEGRAEALCNLWGLDPNDNEHWDFAITHARKEYADGIVPS